MFDGIKTHHVSSARSGSVTPLIEFHQYIKASLFNEIGLSANYNMKRERLTDGEVSQGEDILYPLVDNMMKCRLYGANALNDKYGLDINVDYGSVWAFKNKKLVDDVIESGGSEWIENESLELQLEESLDESLNESLEDDSGGGADGVDDTDGADGVDVADGADGVDGVDDIEGDDEVK